MSGYMEPKRLLDAENVVIPFMRARFDGDPIHDQITWVIQQEHHAESDMHGIPGVVTRTYMIALFQITGVMFHHKEQVPEHFLKDQDMISRWAVRAHKRFLDGLTDQMQQFINDTAQAHQSLQELTEELD